jgi:apolipoprotein D and lipocalin family protein
MGVWYELIHYPSWFQRNDNYNTKAVYSLNSDGSIKVQNSTITQGQYVESIGIAKVISAGQLRVDFAPKEVQNLVQTGQFKNKMKQMDTTEPNYIIDKIWIDKCGNYIFAVVTDLNKDALYLLSRNPQPHLENYNELMSYIVNNYDRDRLVQTPHY